MKKKEKEFRNELSNFIEYVNLHRLNRDMRTVIIGYMKSEMEGGLPDFMFEHLQDLEILFDFLDAIETILHK